MWQCRNEYRVYNMYIDNSGNRSIQLCGWTHNPELPIPAVMNTCIVLSELQNVEQSVERSVYNYI